MACGKFRTAEDYRDHLPCNACEPRPMPKVTEEIREAQSAPRVVGDMKHGLTGSRPQLSILPRTGAIYGGRAIEYGADKYARGNYHGPPPAKLVEKHGPLGAQAHRFLGYIDAAQRHLMHISDAINRALGTGGDLAAACSIVDDEASGNFPPSMLPHVSHALASLLIGVSCAVDGKLLPADPGQPWKALMGGEVGLPQKDNPASERDRVRQLGLQRINRTAAEDRELEPRLVEERLTLDEFVADPFGEKSLEHDWSPEAVAVPSPVEDSQETQVSNEFLDGLRSGAV